MNNQEKREVAAPCGLYCGACSTYIARKRGDKAALNAMAKRITGSRGWVIKLSASVTRGAPNTN